MAVVWTSLKMAAVQMEFARNFLWRGAEKVLGIAAVSDVVDRIHRSEERDRGGGSIHTVSALAFFALLVACKQHIGQPISCFLPAEFHRTRGPAVHAGHRNSPGARVRRAALLRQRHRPSRRPPLGRRPPRPSRSRPRTHPPLLSGAGSQEATLQWVPFMLFLQMLCFFVPGYFWRYLLSCGCMAET